MNALDRGNGFEPGKLWSLLDLMRAFPTDHVFNLLVTASASPFPQRNAAGVIGPAGVSFFRPFITSIRACAENLGADQTVKKTEGLLLTLNDNSLVTDVIHSIIHMIDLLQGEIGKHFLVYIEPEDRQYYERDALFGEVVNKAFPSAALDIRECGSCFACGRYKAAVYHALLAAEIGLRELARDRRVIVKSNKKPIPLDYAQWGELIGAIRTEVAKISAWPRGPVKDAAQIFYGRSLDAAEVLNDAHRRHVMHSRNLEYTRQEALALGEQVQRFLQRLATRLGEQKKVTPLVWKKA